MADDKKHMKKETNPEGQPSHLRRGMFGDAIDVQYGARTRHNSPYLPEGDLAISIIGRRGSGKSTIMLHLLPQIANLSQIIICSRVCMAVSPVYQAIREFCGSRDIDFELFNDPATAKEGIEAMVERKHTRDEGSDHKSDGIIVFDDFTDSSSSRSNAYNSVAITITQIMRNYAYHTMFVTQSSTGVPTLIRNNTNVKIVFPLGEINAIRSIKADFMASGVITNPVKFDRLYQRIIDHKHSYLMLVHGGDDNRLYIYLPDQTPDVPMLVPNDDDGDPADGDDIDAARAIVGTGSDGAPLRPGTKSPIAQLRDMYVKHVGTSSRACAARRRVREHIVEYAKAIARIDGLRFNDVIAAIHEAFPELGLA